MIYDCFTFFNELDLLEIRLNTLAPSVDRFVLVEATRTHTGKPKPLYYQENAVRFAAFKDKIIHIVVDDFSEVRESSSPMEQAWARENIQRNALMRGLSAIDPDDLVMISDLDEFPNLEAARDFISHPVGVARFEQLLGCYYLNMFNCVNKTMCAGTIMMTGATLHDAAQCGCPDVHSNGLVEYVNQGNTITKWRRCIRKERIISGGGWHFSCLGGAEAVAEKLKSIVEGGLVRDQARLQEYARERIILGDDILKRGDRMIARPIDGTFPEYIRNHQQQYAKFIFPVTAEYLRKVRWVPLQSWLVTRPRAIALWLLPDFACKIIRKALHRV